MKKSIYTLILIAGLIFELRSQVVLHEDFSAPFNPAASDWNIQNLSSPVGATSWFQGNASFNALAGAPTDYFAVDFNSTANAGANNTISNWLITPTLNLVNGAIVQFVTRTLANSNFADRLQLYYSTSGNGTNVGNTAGTATNTAGTFTNIVMDLNSNQAASGYPGSWIVITETLSGITTPTVGRLAFRYYLTNAGAAGTTGNFLGIDEFRYSLPCNHAPVVAAWNGQPCSGNPVNLQLMGNTTAINSYTWFTGANTNTTTFTPQNSGMNSIYVLMETTPGCVDLEVANLNVLPSPSVSFAHAPNGNICSGTTITMTAAGANSYTYVLNSTTSSTTNPSSLNMPTGLSNVSFVLKGRGANNCVHTQTVQLAIDPTPTVAVTSPAMVLCIGKTATLEAAGASTYTWSGAGSSTLNPYIFTASAPAGVKNFTVTGRSSVGCVSAEAVFTVDVTNCTTLEELTGGRETPVYPNPFSTHIYFEGSVGSVTIYNELGQLVMAYKSGKVDIVNTTELPAGTYILQITNTSGQNAYRRMIKH